MGATNNPVPLGSRGRDHRPPLEILAELRAIEQGIEKGIEVVEGMQVPFRMDPARFDWRTGRASHDS